MRHMVYRIDKEIPNHLNRFCVLDMNVLFFAHGLHEVLMYQLPNLSPRLAIVHNQEVISLRDQASHDGFGSIAVDVALLVEQVFDELAIRDDQSGICESLQTEYATEFLCPLRQSVCSMFQHSHKCRVSIANTHRKCPSAAGI